MCHLNTVTKFSVEVGLSVFKGLHNLEYVYMVGKEEM